VGSGLKQKLEAQAGQAFIQVESGRKIERPMLEEAIALANVKTLRYLLLSGTGSHGVITIC
jgi:hypothetical protein